MMFSSGIGTFLPLTSYRYPLMYFFSSATISTRRASRTYISLGARLFGTHSMNILPLSSSEYKMASVNSVCVWYGLGFWNSFVIGLSSSIVYSPPFVEVALLNSPNGSIAAVDAMAKIQAYIHGSL